MAIHISERCRVSPSTGADDEQLLPLLHFDIIWLRFHLMENLIFYTIQSSESHFFDTIVPNLKTSLSLTLKHFLPLAAKITFPLTSAMPASRYAAAAEDSVSLTIAISDADLLRLTDYHSKNADDLRDFIPQIPAASHSSDAIKFSAAAVQVTLFPNQGICIGFATHHAACDGASLLRFLHAWASINKFKGDSHLAPQNLPSFDRSGVDGADELASIGWSFMKMSRPTVSSTISLPTGKVRGTFVLSEANVLELKKFVMSNRNRSELGHLSTFVVVCGLVWSCLAKAAADAGEEVDEDDEIEYLSCTADCRSRLSRPLPDTYFGNCLALVVAESSHGRLRGRMGVVDAAEATAEAINKMKNDEGILDGFEKRLKEKTKLIGKRVVKVAGSPRFDVYGADYGWGRPEKYEALHIDCDGAVSLCKSREGGVEIGLSMPNPKMDAFAALFHHGLKEAAQNMHV